MKLPWPLQTASPYISTRYPNLLQILKIPEMWKELVAKFHNCFPYPPGWHFRLADGDTYKLRKMGRPLIMTRYPAIVRIMAIIVLSCWWPWRGMFLAWKYTRRFGKVARDETGLGITRQFFRQWFLALWYSINPLEYYSLSLYRPENAHRIGSFFYNFEAGRYAGIVPGSQVSIIVNDKEAFARFCAERGIVCVPTIGMVGKGYGIRDILWMAGERPLLIKPANGSRGRGVIAIERAVEGNFLLNRKNPVSYKEAETYFSDVLGVGRFLVQPLLKNHRGLADLCVDGLASIRIVTILNQPAGKAEYLMAVLQIPRKGSITSNSGTFCAVNAADGTLGEGHIPTPCSPPFLHHPGTGILLKGKKVPYWAEAKALALRAHTQLGGYSSLGWDVAVTDEGPVLLETNSGWGMGMMQRAFQVPLGETGFPNPVIVYLSYIKSKG